MIRTKEQTGRRIRVDLVLPVGFEPTTIRLELFCSGPLSYGSKVDACFGSGKATTLFQRSNSFFLEYCCCLGIHVFRLLFARGLRIPPYFAMLRLHMALCHASCSRQASNLRRTPFRGVPLPVGLRENLADCSSPRSTFVADINLSIPKERRKWDAGHGEECGGGMVPVEQPKRIGNPSDDDRNRVGRYHSA